MRRQSGSLLFDYRYSDIRGPAFTLSASYPYPYRIPRPAIERHDKVKDQDQGYQLIRCPLSETDAGDGESIK